MDTELKKKLKFFSSSGESHTMIYKKLECVK